MDKTSDLLTNTSIYFDLVNFSELNEGWINEVVGNEFTEAEENNISLSMLFAHEAPETLCQLAKICSVWCESAIGTDLDESNSDIGLWKILENLDINVKHIQCLVYLLCKRAMKTDASVEDTSIGLSCGQMYFNILRVPGSGAYSLYHPNLFNLCIDCLPAPDFTSDANSSLKDFEKLNFVYVSTLLSLIPILRYFHLEDDSNTLQHAIKKLSELAACEVKINFNFKTNYFQMGEKELQRKFRLPTIVSILAYEAFSAILASEINGNKDTNFLHITYHLSKHILCYKAKKCQTIPQKYLVIKNNAVAFLGHHLQTQDISLEAAQIAIKGLCIGVIDKVEFRNSASATIISMLLNMNIETRTEAIEWFLELIDSDEIKHRVFALDIFNQILSNESNANIILNISQNDLLKLAIIFATLTRCDDVSPAVRTNALTVVSQNMKCILIFLDTKKEERSFETGEMDDDVELDVNGTHRYFWYIMKSYRKRLDEIAEILRRRLEDDNVTARKAALLALENLVIFDRTYVTEENLKCFGHATVDPNIIVRKQVMQSVSVIFETYKENDVVQALWIKCILPLVLDSEATVQKVALSLLEDQFLHKVFSSNQSDWTNAFTLLNLLLNNDYLAHHKYLEKAFSMWKSENRLKSQAIIQFEKYVGTEWEECVWFYISNFSMYCAIPVRVSNLLVDQFESFDVNGVYPTSMQYVLNIISHVLENLSSEKSATVCRIISNNLMCFSVPIDFIPSYIEIFYKVYQPSGSQPSFLQISSSIIKKCEAHLNQINSTTRFTEPLCEELLQKYFSIIKEFCQLCPSHITPSVTSLLKSFSACTKPPPALSKKLSPGLKAHALAALGKLCLQDESLAKELLPIFAKQLQTSKHDVIRNNAVIILCEMCKRYTSLAEIYVPLISLCIKDKHYLIRYQTIVLILNLVKEDYLKSKGALIFCLLSSLVDENETIQHLGRCSLLQLVTDKKKNLLSLNFLDSVFVFNFFRPPDNKTLSQTVKDLEKFSMPGERRREERMLLYIFLLESMEYRERACLVFSIRDILANVTDSVYPLNATTECIVRDCFAILTCKEIRSIDYEQFPNIEEAAENELHEAEVNVRRQFLINPIIPAIVSLNNSLANSQSSIVRDIILFLKEFLHDFKDYREILAVDKILLMQLELQIKNDTEREQKEGKKKNDQSKPVAAEQVQSGSSTEMAELQEIANASNIVEIDRDCMSLNISAIESLSEAMEVDKSGAGIP